MKISAAALLLCLALCAGESVASKTVQRQQEVPAEDRALWDRILQESGMSMPPTDAPVTAETPRPTSAPVMTDAPETPRPTSAPVTAAPVPAPSPAPIMTEAPVTEAPVTDAPVMSEAPVSDAPVTTAPVVDPTDAPVTAAPVVDPTDAPVTAAPVVDPTDAPVTTAPVVDPTDAPVTAAPVVDPTDAPVTAAPVVDPTDAPATAAPAGTGTDAPVAAPVTGAPASGPTPPPVENNIRSIVAPVALNGGSEWDDAESYAAKAITWLESDTFSLTLSDEKIQQRYALASIYYATFAVQTIYTVVEPRGWIDATGWVSGVDECGWFGLTCNADGLVEKIVLPSNRITGTFPAEAAIMAGSVTRIDLFRNSVYNTGDEGNAWLGQMTNLKELFYGQTNFEYDGIPPQIASLTNLVEYDCSFTLYFGPLTGSTFAPLQSLEYLVLSGNAYNTSIPVEIGQLPNLQFLYVQNAFVDGDLSFMAPMTSIVECWVDQNPGLGGAIPTTIGNVQTLQSWSITRCGFTGPLPTELGNLRNMVRMWVYDNMLTGPVPVEMGNLFKLQTLEIEENLLTGVMPDDVCLNRVPSGLLEVLEADCAGTPAEITCDCCTCCESCLPALARTMAGGEDAEFDGSNRRLQFSSL